MKRIHRRKTARAFISIMMWGFCIAPSVYGSSTTPSTGKIRTEGNFTISNGTTEEVVGTATLVCKSTSAEPGNLLIEPGGVLKSLGDLTGDFTIRVKGEIFSEGMLSISASSDRILFKAREGITLMGDTFLSGDTIELRAAQGDIELQDVHFMARKCLIRAKGEVIDLGGNVFDCEVINLGFQEQTPE